MIVTLCYQDVLAEQGRPHHRIRRVLSTGWCAPRNLSKGRSGGTLDGTAIAAPWGEAGTSRPGNLRARTRQLTSQAYEGIAVHRYTLPGDSQGDPSARPAVVPHQDHRIDARYGDDRFAHFWASGDDTSDYQSTNQGQSTYGAPDADRTHRFATKAVLIGVAMVVEASTAASGVAPERRSGCSFPLLRLPPHSRVASRWRRPALAASTSRSLLR